MLSSGELLERVDGLVGKMVAGCALINNIKTGIINTVTQCCINTTAIIPIGCHCVVLFHYKDTVNQFIYLLLLFSSLALS
jgi:hypothetical protein